jgi:MFS family permease
MQGSIMGVGQSVDALGRIIGPVLAGFAFDGWGIAWPYIVGAAIGGVAFLVSLTVAMPGRR